MMQKINPNAKAAIAAEVKAQAARKVSRAAAIKEKRSKAGAAAQRLRRDRFNGLNSGLE
jgi:hypothetical protein